MKAKTLGILLFGICTLGLAQEVSPPPQTLHVHLPRQISLQDSDVRLGKICILRGSDTLVTQASDIRLGQLFNPSQNLTLQRAQILSRLACCGLRDTDVRITGANQVEISRNSQKITGPELIALARPYAQALLPATMLCTLEPLRTPRDMVLGETSSKVQLVPTLIGRIGPTQMRIRVSAQVQGKSQTQQDITFRLQHQRRTLVSTTAIATGEALTRMNTKVETRPCPMPPKAWQPPYGQIAKQVIAPAQEIQSSWIEPLVVPVTLKRNDAVVIRIEHPGLLITAMGKMLSDANGGEVVKVKNLDSNRIILCRVETDGTVAPLL